MPLEQLAYEEAKRAIDRQSSTLDGLRSRAGVLLAAISLATSFVGGLALRSGDRSRPNVGLAAAAIFFALLAVALFILRRRPAYMPLQRAWGYPVLPALFIASSLVIVVNQLMHEPRDSAIGLGLVLVGFPVYMIWSRRPRTITRRTLA